MISRHKQKYLHLNDILRDRSFESLEFQTNVFGEIQFIENNEIAYERTPEIFMRELCDTLNLMISSYEPPRSVKDDAKRTL